ncbi:uncharacterized protein B0I36DRAFT_412731 [Microdochium trichocladiopsis]|uniref:Uncharacterized protein n=1 Tax=Microdochium trichocladiopsis TaxID=1682393 RepID=A0A9P8Y3L5_9PEZI|nr:uncharacterized protein B0I36DRAFT_412731 [Microdochium trichocladiopsis]KAH7027297.1 hypothetical protein B0I36DRAFT_412731 [Microdochium trichocladiopsis]
MHQLHGLLSQPNPCTVSDDTHNHHNASNALPAAGMTLDRHSSSSDDVLDVEHLTAAAIRLAQTQTVGRIGRLTDDGGNQDQACREEERFVVEQERDRNSVNMPREPAEVGLTGSTPQPQAFQLTTISTDPNKVNDDLPLLCTASKDQAVNQTGLREPMAPAEATTSSSELVVIKQHSNAFSTAPPVAFTNMLDVNEPRYLADNTSERRLCRVVIISNVPRKLDTLSSILSRVRGGMLVCARLVDLSDWPTNQNKTKTSQYGLGSKDGSGGVGGGATRMAYIEFADPREAAAYVAYVNDIELVNKNVLFSCEGQDRGLSALTAGSPDSSGGGVHARDEPQVQVRLAGTPSYPLPAYIHRMIQAEGATRCVVVRYQAIAAVHDSDAQSATGIAAAGIIEKCMGLIERRFLSTWPYRAPDREGSPGGGRERYPLLEHAWIEQEFTPVKDNETADLGPASSDQIDDDGSENARINEQAGSHDGNDAAPSHEQHNHGTQTKDGSATTTLLHLSFCKLEHAIRAASALRYQIHASSSPSLSSSSVLVGFGRDRCAGDIDELQDIASALPFPSGHTATPQPETLDHDEQAIRQVECEKLSILEAWKSGTLGQVLEDNFPGFIHSPPPPDAVTAHTRRDTAIPARRSDQRDTDDLLGLHEGYDDSKGQKSATSPPASSARSTSPSLWSLFTPVSPTDAEDSPQASDSCDMARGGEARTQDNTKRAIEEFEEASEEGDDDLLLF